MKQVGLVATIAREVHVDINKRSVKTRLAAVAMAVVATGLLAAACTTARESALDSTSSPSDTASRATATQAATGSEALPVSNTSVLPASPTGDAPAQPVAPAQELTPDDIVAAHEAVLTELYDRVAPSVVKITTSSAAGGGEGSGFIWDKEGHIVTNYHVVEGANNITVLFLDGKEYAATVAGADPDGDIAVIKIDAPADSLVPALIGKSSDARVGQMAIAIGNPFGHDFTMTTGIVSAVGRGLSSGFSNYLVPAVIQTDAAINPGNSGGPLLDRFGRVIGINTQIEGASRQNSGVGFAVPIDLIKRIVPSLIETGGYSYAYLGISGADLDLAVKTRAGLPADTVGVLLQQVTPGGPAATAGLLGGTRTALINGQTFPLGGDIVISVDDAKVRRMDDLIAYLALNKSPGDKVELGIVRDGEAMTVTVELGARPD